MAKRKRRRLNKRFVVLLVSVGALLALGVLALIILLQPKDPDRYAAQGAELFKDGKYEAAERSYRIAAQESRRPEYLLEWGKVMLDWRNNDPSLSAAQRGQLFFRAREAFREALRHKPDFLDAQQELAGTALMVARSRNQPTEWMGYIKELDRLLELIPDDEESRTRFNEALFERARAKERVAESRSEYLQRAQRDYQELLRRAPKEEGYWLQLGIFNARHGRAIWTCSDHPETRASEPGACPVCQKQLVSATEPARQAAEATYKEAIAAVPDSVRLRVAYSSFILGQADRRKKEEYQAGLARAKALLDEAVGKQPDEVLGYLALAEYHQKQKEYPQAIGMLEEAIKRDPTDFRGYGGLARLQRHLLGPEEAEEALVRGLEAVRKSAPGGGAGLEGEALRQHREAVNKYRQGVMVLNNLLCDALLDRLGEEAKAEEILPRVKSALEEMRGIQPDHPFVHKTAGRIALAENDLIEAEKLLRKAYEAFGTAFEAKTAGLLISLYRRLNQLGESQRILERYLLFAKNEPSLLLNLVRLHIDYRQYDNAQAVLQQVLKLDQDPETEISAEVKKAALSLQAGLAAVSGKADRIPPEVESLDPYSARLFLRRAQQLWLDGEQTAAIQLLQDLLARDPRNFGAIAQLVRWHQDRQETEQAQTVVNRALAVFSDRPDLQERLGMLLETDPAKVLAHRLQSAEKLADPFARALRKAEIYNATGKEQEFLQQLKAAEALNPKSEAVIEMMFRYALLKSDWQTAEKYAEVAAQNNTDTVGGKLYQGRLAFARQDFDGAIRLGLEALANRSRYDSAHAFLGVCYFAKQDYEKAQAEYEAAYELNPSNVRALLGMIEVAERTGATGEYERLVTLAYQFVPGEAEIRERYYQIRQAQEEPEKFIKRREQIRRSRPDDRLNLYRLAALYERTGQVAKAEDVYRAIFAVSKGHPDALRALADFLRRTDRDGQAQGMLEENLKNSADKTGAYLLWAEYLENAGSLGQARNVFEKAVEADTDGRAYERMAKFVWRQGKFAEAADYQQEYLARADEKPGAGGEYWLILYRIQARQYAPAEKRLEELLRSNPGDYRALTLKAVEYYYRKDYSQAKQLLDQALDLKPQYVLALRHRAELHLISGNSALAARDLQAAVRAGPRGDPQDALRLAKIYSDMGNFGSAYGVMQNLLAERPGYRPAVTGQAVLCLVHKRWPTLEKLVADGRRASPRDVFYLEIEAEMWRARSEPARAIRPLQQALGLLPPERRGPTAVRLADALVEAEQYAQAAQLLRSLLDGGQVGAAGRAILGRAYVKQDKPAEADKEFIAALKAAQPGELSAVLIQIRDAYEPDEAVKKLRGWLALRPDDWQMPYQVAELMRERQKDYRGAAGLLENALTKAKTDNARWRVYRSLAVVYDYLGEFEKCRAAYEETLRLNDKDDETRNNLAWLLAYRLGKPQEALPYAERAVRSFPNNAYVLDTYGLVLLLKGDLPKADDALNRSIAIQSFPANHLHLGQVYEKMGRNEEALRQYRRGWELIKDQPKETHYDELRRAVERLGGALSRRTGS